MKSRNLIKVILAAFCVCAMGAAFTACEGLLGGSLNSSSMESIKESIGEEGSSLIDENVSEESFSEESSDEGESSIEEESAREEESSVEEHTHAYTSTTVEPTCTEKGLTTYVCGCGDAYEEEIPATGVHTWDEGAVTIDPTCTEKGEKLFTCTVCRTATYMEDVDALGHDEKTREAKEPTCAEIGWEAYVTCGREGCEYSTYQEISALAHDKEEIKGKQPTCTAIGWYTYEVCQRKGCTYTTYEERAALGHTGGTATCTTSAICERCETSYGEALGHDNEQVQAKEPTCTSIGWYAYEVCQRKGCTYTTYEERAALGHTGGTATCTDTAECERCGEKYGENLGGHIGGMATCTNKALCTRCGQEHGELLPHDFYNGFCKDCNASDSNFDGEIEDDGHSILSAPDYTFNSPKELTLDDKMVNTTETYDLRGKFTVSNGASWRAFTDAECSQPNEITTRIASLNAGWNDVYILVENNSTYQQSVYQLRIYRRKMFTVKVYYNETELYKTYTIEEDEKLGDYITFTKEDYTFNGVFYKDHQYEVPVSLDSILTGSFSFYVDAYYHGVTLSGGMVTGLKEEQKGSLKLSINQTYDGVEVTAIGENAFKDVSGLIYLEIPNSVTSIDRWAFSGCDSLTGVYIADIAAWCAISFGNIYANPLYHARNLYLNNELVTELVIPGSVTKIGNYAFYDCGCLTNHDTQDAYKKHKKIKALGIPPGQCLSLCSPQVAPCTLCGQR